MRKSPEYRKYAHLAKRYSKKRRLDSKSSYAIFLDGKNATKNHEKDMISEDGFAYHMFCAIQEVVKQLNLPSCYYVAMDEATIFFRSGKEIIEASGENEEDKVLALFVSMFSIAFSSYDCCAFKGVIYPIRAYDVNKMIEYRKFVTGIVSKEYFVKEYYGKGNYVANDEADLDALLKKKHLYKKYLTTDIFRNGIKGKYLW